jgi:hypothetical protein
MISEVVTDKDKANELSAKLYEVEANLSSKVLEYEGKLVEAQSAVIVAEANSESIITKNWRPVTALTFVALVVAKWLGYTAPGISEAVELQLMEIIKVMIGGYVVGRSVENSLPAIADAIKAFKKN